MSPPNPPSAARGTAPGQATDEGILASKRLAPQPPPRGVQRERLMAALDRAVATSAVTLVRAPAGSGKTALVAAWARSGRAPGRVAWLQLHHLDSNRTRFWRQVVLAVAESQASPALARRMVPSPGAVDTVLASLVATLSDLSEPVVLVLDDLHEIEDDEIMQDLELLLRSPPAGLRLVIVARRDPPLRLQRLRLAGALSELPPEELAFTIEEAADLFAAAGLELDAADVRQLWERTEGWVAGLALTALALRGRGDVRAFIDGFAGDVVPVADYLLEEVLADQPPRVRAFLLATSVVTEVCGDLADAITEQTGSAVLLERLHHGGVLTSAIDDNREWYRYHGLLADLMRTVLRREDPELLPVLHRRAAHWHGDHGYTVRACRHAVYAGDVDYLTELTATRMFSQLAKGQIGELAVIIRMLPGEELGRNPVLALALSAAAIEVGDVAEAGRWGALAQSHADTVDPAYRSQFEKGAAVVELYRARIAGDVDDGLQITRQLMAEGAEDEALGVGSDLDALALVHLGALEVWTGDLEAGGRDLSRGLKIAVARDRRYLQLYATVHLAVHAMASGDLIGSMRLAHDAITIAEEHGWLGLARTGVATTVLAAGAIIQGKFDDAQLLMDDALLSVTQAMERPARANTLLHRARLLRLQGRPEEALPVLADVRAEVQGTPFAPMLEGFVEAEQAHAMLAAGRREEAVEQLERGVLRGMSGEVSVALALVHLQDGNPKTALATLAPWTGPEIGRQLKTTQVSAFVVASRAHRAAGNRPAADEALERALALAEPTARRLPFLEQGPEFIDELSEHVARGTQHAAFIAEIQDLLLGREAISGALPPREPLSARELEVLRFLPTSLTNREIAAELCVSVNTVKTHLKQVYAKLEGHDRRDAVRRARLLGLIP